MQKQRKILLMYITRVSGHRQATLAIQKSLKVLDPTVEVSSINGFGYTYPRLEKVVNRAYMGVIRRTPKVWDYLYDNPKVVKRTGSIKKFLHRTSHKKLEVLFKKHNPDTVVCTQAFPCGMVADYKRENNLNFTLIGVLTDFAPHAFWINEGVDYYIVPSEESRERFMSKGVASDAIKTYGIPVQPKFAQQMDKAPIAARLGLDLDKPIILIMGGGQGLGPIKEIVTSLSKLKIDLQMIVIAGTNKKLKTWLKEMTEKTEKKIKVYEYSRKIDELMEISDLIITKPGGMTTAECLSKGLPMVIVNPIPGQEMRNTDFLLNKGIAIRVDEASDISEEIEFLLKSSERIASMNRAAYENSKSHAAPDIAKLILHK